MGKVRIETPVISGTTWELCGWDIMALSHFRCVGGNSWARLSIANTPARVQDNEALRDRCSLPRPCH
jgi:hypothetical protein